jgi:hypothetical protein
MTKMCVSCKTEKPLEDFGKNRRQLDGLNYYCKACNTARVKKYRAAEGALSLHKLEVTLNSMVEQNVALGRIITQQKTTLDMLQATLQATTASLTEQPELVEHELAELDDVDKLILYGQQS